MTIVTAQIRPRTKPVLLPMEEVIIDLPDESHIMFLEGVASIGERHLASIDRSVEFIMRPTDQVGAYTDLPLAVHYRDGTVAHYDVTIVKEWVGPTPEEDAGLATRHTIASLVYVDLELHHGRGIERLYLNHRPYTFEI